jgi:hypothetical protein
MPHKLLVIATAEQSRVLEKSDGCKLNKHLPAKTAKENLNQRSRA